MCEFFRTFAPAKVLHSKIKQLQNKIATYEANLGKAKPRTLKELIEDEKAAKSAENNNTTEE